MGMDQDTGLAEVLAANERFYDVLRSGDFAEMDGLWSERTEVSVYHPNWPGITGRAEVMTSWYQVMVLSEPPAIFSRSPLIVREGNVAMVFCTEDMNGQEMTASNVFVNEDGTWRLTSHHARPLPLFGEDVGDDGDGASDAKD
ncbi:MAG: nuclear transport factor 2 family protein [Alphaproteobacteria bacterium]|nr:nuclear transport factor 2 family protein [Alphaproteobacteria bacterium]